MTDESKACDTFEEAEDELRLAVTQMRSGEWLEGASIGRFALGDYMKNSIAGKFYWIAVFLSARRAGVATGEAAGPSDEKRMRDALQKVREAVADGRAHIAEREA